MADTPLTARDYPIAETSPDDVTGNRGKALSSLTMEAVLSGDISMEDLRITPRALEQQAEISKSVGRSTLARNFERAAEMAQIHRTKSWLFTSCCAPAGPLQKTAFWMWRKS